MRKLLPIPTFVFAAALTMLGAPVYAGPLIFDADVTPDVLFGSGNANGSFTVDRSNNVEVGLRGKLRHNAAGAPENTFNSNGDGTYSFAAGVAPTQASPTAVWSFEWSINSDLSDTTGTPGRTLNELTYALGYDSDASQGTSYTVLDVINGLPFFDHSIGNNLTGNGAGVEATDALTYAALIDANNVAQNSWKAHWFLAPFDPTVDGTYNFYLEAFDGLTSLARTDIQIIVGAGGASVPEPSAMALLALGLTGLGYARRRKAKA